MEKREVDTTATIQLSPRDTILATLCRVREAGESQEMAARWIIEDLNKSRWTIVNATWADCADDF